MEGKKVTQGKVSISQEFYVKTKNMVMEINKIVEKRLTLGEILAGDKGYEISKFLHNVRMKFLANPHALKINVYVTPVRMWFEIFTLVEDVGMNTCIIFGDMEKDANTWRTFDAVFKYDGSGNFFFQYVEDEEKWTKNAEKQVIEQMEILTQAFHDELNEIAKRCFR